MSRICSRTRTLSSHFLHRANFAGHPCGTGGVASNGSTASAMPTINTSSGLETKWLAHTCNAALHDRSTRLTTALRTRRAVPSGGRRQAGQAKPTFTRAYTQPVHESYYTIRCMREDTHMHTLHKAHHEICIFYHEHVECLTYSCMSCQCSGHADDRPSPQRSERTCEAPRPASHSKGALLYANLGKYIYILCRHAPKVCGRCVIQ